MQFNSDSGSSLQSDINITPLVDVVLVLLIIFMVVVPLLMEGYDVEIPRASADSSTAQVEEKQLIMSIGSQDCPILTPPSAEGIPKDCQITLADQKIPAAELPTRVAALLGGRPPEQRALFLAVDDRLNYEGLLRIIDLAKSGVDDLKIEFIAAN